MNPKHHEPKTGLKISPKKLDRFRNKAQQSMTKFKPGKEKEPKSVSDERMLLYNALHPDIESDIENLNPKIKSEKNVHKNEKK